MDHRWPADCITGNPIEYGRDARSPEIVGIEMESIYFCGHSNRVLEVVIAFFKYKKYIYSGIAPDPGHLKYY